MRTRQTGAVAGSAKQHTWRIADAEYVRHEERRGRRFAYGPTAPHRIALVVIDLVPFFTRDNAYARGIVPVVERAATALRSAGGTVAWVHPSAGEPTEWQIGFFGHEIARRYASSGTGGDTAAGLTVRTDDLVVEKSLPSPFSPGSSELEARLRSAGIERLWIAGTLTSVCCESTVREAASLGYEVVLLADATADATDAAHNATLRTVYRSFGDVRTADEVVQELDRRPGE